MPSMRADGTFTVKSYAETPTAPVPPVETGLPVVVLTMEKVFEGGVTGHAATLLTAAFDQKAFVGSYVAMESFEGSLNGVSGAFNFAHTAATTGRNRTDEWLLIVANSGTGDLKGISGTGGIAIDEDGTHRIWFEYDLG
jgi:hypothetical protein